MHDSTRVVEWLAEFTLAGRAALANQGPISDIETKLLERARSGEINEFTPTEMKRFLEITQETARDAYEQHEGNMEWLKDLPGGAPYLPSYKVAPFPYKQRWIKNKAGDIYTSRDGGKTWRNKKNGKLLEQ